MIAFKTQKTILVLILGLLTFSAVHAQQTVVVERPGLFTDLATALIGVPAAAATGIVEGTVEAVGALFNGSTTVVSAPAPVVVVPATPAPPPPAATPVAVVVPRKQVVVTSPIVKGVPYTTVTTTVRSPVKVPGATIIPDPTTTITTDYGDGTTVTVTRPASGYELGGGIVYPVDPAHRVGSSPFANPYIYRP